MSFYRSYQKANDIMAQYSYTLVYGTQAIPIGTHAIEINNASFNYPIIIGNQVVNCENMLANCTSFNQPLYFHNNVHIFNNMLRNCRNFNQDIHFENRPVWLAFMLADCPNFGGNIYADNIYAANVHGLFLNKNVAKRVNIFTGYFSSGSLNNIVGGGNNVINSWTTNSICKYNTAYNIYIYNNYTG